MLNPFFLQHVIKPIADALLVIMLLIIIILTLRSIVAVRAEAMRLRTSETRFRELFNYANDAVFLTTITAEGRIFRFIEVNEKLCGLLGYEREELLTLTPLDIMDRTDWESFNTELARLISQEVITCQLTFITKQGTLVPIEMSSRISLIANEKVMLSIARDITERRLADHKIHQLAFYDELTNLPNRRLITQEIEKGLSEAKHQHAQAALLYLDMDRFKLINDSLGHSYGDVALVEMSNRLKRCLGEQGMIARMGGDEFMLFLPRIRQLSEVESIAQKLLESFEAPLVLKGIEMKVTTSIGIAIYPEQGHDTETIIKNADRAMYHAKAKGKNNYQFFSSEMHQALIKKVNLEKDMSIAIQNEAFQLYYQPQIDLDTNQLCGLEALIRWEHESYGNISPVEFIPLAEETGYIIPIGEWVLKTACLQNKHWQDSGICHVPVKVNLSARQFQQPNLVEMVSKVLRETSLEPHYLELEITESAMMEDSEGAIQVLRELKLLGIKLSIDDFGTGFSSLNYLKNLPIDALKIDRSFVRDIARDPKDEAIITTIINLAHNLRLTVIAEGVEVEQQEAFLRQLKCDQVQGFLYGKPTAVGDIEALLSHSKMHGVPR